MGTPYQSDPVYLAAVAAYNRASGDANLQQMLAGNKEPFYSAYWNLNNYIHIINGDTSLGGTPISQEIRNAVINPDGTLTAQSLASLPPFTATVNHTVDAEGFVYHAYPDPDIHMNPVDPNPAHSTTPTATVTTTPTGTSTGIPTTSMGTPFLGGLLDGAIFGIDKKLVAVGVIAFFLLKDK